MAKTVLDLTAEELQQYQPGREPDAEQAEARWEQAWQVAHRAARLLRDEFGASRVAAFGSLAHRAWFGPRSDIDLAAWGIPNGHFYRAVAAVTGVSPEFGIDLVDPGDCRPAVLRSIEQEGIDL